MPKQTFLNIAPNKRVLFTNAFFLAFTKSTYDDTSISLVLKQNGFAKGSFYQYFENKLDLFNYLIQHASTTKLVYVNTIKRKDFDDFWTYWREMYKAGIQFDANEPIQSNFLFKLNSNIKSPSLIDMFNAYKLNAITYFEKMIKHEVEQNLFRADLPTHIMAHFMVENSQQMFNYYQIKNKTISENNINKGLPIFYSKKCKTTFLEVLDLYIELMKSALSTIK